MKPRVTDEERAKMKDLAARMKAAYHRRFTELTSTAAYAGDEMTDNASWLAAAAESMHAMAAELAEVRAELERLRPIVDSVIKAQEAHDACELGRGNAAECDACDRMMEIADDRIRTERARRDGAGREG